MAVSIQGWKILDVLAISILLYKRLIVLTSLNNNIFKKENYMFRNVREFRPIAFIVRFVKYSLGLILGNIHRKKQKLKLLMNKV